jgi:hypothetical protein
MGYYPGFKPGYYRFLGGGQFGGGLNPMMHSHYTSSGDIRSHGIDAKAPYIACPLPSYLAQRQCDAPDVAPAMNPLLTSPI